MNGGTGIPERAEVCMGTNSKISIPVGDGRGPRLSIIR